MTAGSLVGKTVGNYEVRSKIGEGGMGVVYLAEHPRITKRVAVKVLNARLDVDKRDEHLRRFLNEARAASEIRSDHVIDIFDFGELPDGAPYLVMEWLEGEALSKLIAREGPLATARALHILRGIARALGAAHALGVVHRDLKPDNVFIVNRNGDHDFVKVLDFGIAKLACDDQASMQRTATGALMGTPAYMSPEQCRGLRSVDHRSDIYSLGVIAYELLTGRLPFVAEGLGDLLLAHLFQTPQAPAVLVPEVLPHVSEAVMVALAKEPDQRFSSPEELLDAMGRTTEAPVESVEAGERSSRARRPITLPRAGMPTTLSRASKEIPTLPVTSPEAGARSRLLLLLVAGGAVSLLLAGGAALFLRGWAAPVVAPSPPIAASGAAAAAPMPVDPASSAAPAHPAIDNDSLTRTKRPPADRKDPLVRDFPEAPRPAKPAARRDPDSLRRALDEPGPPRPRLKLQTDFPSR